jgi:spermidine/putrescine-binding protein
MVMLTISFISAQWKQICTKIEVAQEEMGAQSATDLMTFLAEAESAENAAELIDFRGEEIGEGDSLSFAIGSDYRATLTVVGQQPTRKPSGEIDWDSVQHMMIGITKC